MSEEKEAVNVPYIEAELMRPLNEPFVTLGVSASPGIEKRGPIASVAGADEFINILLSNILYHVKNIEEKLGGEQLMSSKQIDENKITAFNAASVVKEMNEEAEKAILKASVSLEDTRNFLRARGKTPS